MDKKILEEKLRNSKVTTLGIIKQLAESPVLTRESISHATVLRGEALGGQMGTISRMGISVKAGNDLEGNQRWILSPEVDREWLKETLDRIYPDSIALGAAVYGKKSRNNTYTGDVSTPKDTDQKG